MKIRNLIYIIIFLFIASCSVQDEEKVVHDFEVGSFEPITNLNNENEGIKTIYLDYENAIDSGFIIPSINQIEDGLFEFEFTIKNNSKEPQEYYYKIYYQNSSYKFEEFIQKDDGKKHNPLSGENFYGSWENVNTEYKSTKTIPNDGEFHTIRNSFRIVGNPRDEKKYYGARNINPTEEDLYYIIKRIKGDENWIKGIKEKARDAKISIESQIMKDAVYVYKNYQTEDLVNNRWKRNPRVGNYSFLLVISDKKNYLRRSVPDYIENISKTYNNQFINPFYFFLYGEGKNMKNIVSVYKKDDLKVIAQPNTGSGLYVDPDITMGAEYDKSFYDETCSDDSVIYANAHFQQHFHSLKDKHKINNIPIVEDIFVSDYTKDLYAENSNKYGDEERIKTNIYNSNCPCKTVRSDKEGQKLILSNPASKEGEWKKENVGIMSRHGLTYGKYRFKAKLTDMLNSEYVWNGITNAIWLIYQNGTWNNRRVCSEKGYIPKSQSGQGAERKKVIDYSEIDIEIIKSSEDWPSTSYYRSLVQPKNNDKKEDIIISCTNWDLACQDPPSYRKGAWHYQFQDKVFVQHRWDDYYKAVTIKTPINEEEVIDSEYYYFEIEWKPTEIIWRVGPEPDNMRVVGYMNEETTSVPNNQMLIVFTQEFHLSEWWPMTQYKQENIPFPKNDYEGEIFEVIIE